ncbi:MAG: hypothetical protein ACI84C_002280 [Flavobacteriales bacterium]|jgi:hypothetical protein
MSHRHVFQYLLFIVLLASCNANPLDVDVSKIRTSQKFTRFDQSVIKVRGEGRSTAYSSLIDEYGIFGQDYFEFVLQLGNPADTNTLEVYDHIMGEDSLLMLSQSEIERIHGPLIEKYNSGLTNAWKHFQFHFPEETVPDITYINSWFNYAIVPSDDLVAIGLDFFLGAENEVTKALPVESFPQYFKRKMEPRYVVSDAVRGWLMVKYQDQLKQGKLINSLIWYGKMMYLMDVCLPNVADSIKMSYPEGDIEWCEDSEEGIWLQLANQQVMFETNRFEISKWFVDGPFTRAGDLPQDAPAQLGIWTGWQIVRDYMKENPEISIQDLIDEENDQKIMKYYDPRN